MAFGLQLRSDRREIINLAIEGQGKRAIVGQHRLRAACKIDDGKPSVAETDTSGGPHTRSIGTSMDHGIRHQPDRSEEHTSELQSLMRTSYAVFCLKNKLHNILLIHHISRPQQISMYTHK